MLGLSTTISRTILLAAQSGPFKGWLRGMRMMALRLQLTHVVRKSERGTTNRTWGGPFCTFSLAFVLRTYPS